MKRCYVFFAKNWSFLEFQCIFKEVKTKRRIFRQSWTKQWNFSRFSTISLHHKWNRTRLLQQSSECTSCINELANNLRLYELGNFKKIPEMFEYDGNLSARHQKVKFWCFLVRNCIKAVAKHSIEKPILLISWVFLQPFVQDLWINNVKCYNACFYCMSKSRYQNILNLRC